eukprot:COSAG06_NODE_7855_length_2352_cov_2.588992_2_plen_341_part_00
MALRARASFVPHVGVAALLLHALASVSAQDADTVSKLTYDSCSTPKASDAIEFDVHEPDGGTGRIVSSDGRCLSVKDCVVPAPGSTGDWQAVVLEECGDGTCEGKHQQWESIPVAGKEGMFYLQNGLGKGWCLNIPPNRGQAAAQADLIVWGGVGGGQGCNPAVGDVSNQWFTFKSDHIVTDEVAVSSELLTGCKPNCCIAAAPCTPPTCTWTAPLGWGFSFIIALGVGASLYVAGGAAYAQKVQGKEVSPATALTTHPHYERWVALSGMVVDGVVFSRARVEKWRAGDRVGYNPVDDQATTAQQPVVETDQNLGSSNKTGVAEETSNNGESDEEEALVE